MELKPEHPGHMAWPNRPNLSEEESIREVSLLIYYLRDHRKLSIEDAAILLKTFIKGIEEDIAWNLANDET